MTSITGVALRNIKYNDTTSIAMIWTVERGCMSVVMPSGSSREARRRKAIMMPLGVFEGVAHIRPGQEVARVGDMRQLVPSPASSGNPVRGAIAMFVSEFLYLVLKESGPDPLLGKFIIESIEDLNEVSGLALANYHLMFLYRLGHFLGIEPDMATYKADHYFDIKEARFTATEPLHRQFLNPKQAGVVRCLSRLNKRNLHLLHINHDQRNQILDGILQYYTIHHSPISSLPSLKILRSLFN